MKKNLLLTFIFSFIPGASQMYMTYMKRGLSVMTIFALLSVLLGFAGTPIFAIPLALVMAWSFFDTWNLRNMNDEKRKEFKDEFIWETEEWKSLLPKSLDKKKKLIFGYALIFIGAYVLLLQVTTLLENATGNYFEVIYPIIRFIRNDLPAAVVAVLVVVLGIKLIKE